MKCSGCQGFRSLASIGGLFLAGMGGYNLVTTGCPLGSCSGSCEVSEAAQVQPAKVEMPIVSTDACEKKSGSCEGTPCTAPSESATRTD
jgi:hypothetical protein